MATWKDNVQANERDWNKNEEEEIVWLSEPKKSDWSYIFQTPPSYGVFTGP